MTTRISENLSPFNAASPTALKDFIRFHTRRRTRDRSRKSLRSTTSNSQSQRRCTSQSQHSRAGLGQTVFGKTSNRFHCRLRTQDNSFQGTIKSDAHSGDALVAVVSCLSVTSYSLIYLCATCFTILLVCFYQFASVFLL